MKSESSKHKESRPLIEERLTLQYQGWWESSVIAGCSLSSGSLGSSLTPISDARNCPKSRNGKIKTPKLRNSI